MGDFLALLCLNSLCCSEAAGSSGYVEKSLVGNRKLISDLLGLRNV